MGLILWHSCLLGLANVRLKTGHTFLARHKLVWHSISGSSLRQNHFTLWSMLPGLVKAAVRFNSTDKHSIYTRPVLDTCKTQWT